MSCLRQSLSISLVLPLLFSVAAVDLAKATDVTIEGNSYATDSANFVNVSSLVPGQAHVFDLLLTEQTTNATLGNFLGFCVDLRSDNLNQCQYTLQLAEGTLQVSLYALERPKWSLCHASGLQSRAKLTCCDC